MPLPPTGVADLLPPPVPSPNSASSTAPEARPAPAVAKEVPAVAKEAPAAAKEAASPQAVAQQPAKRVKKETAPPARPREPPAPEPPAPKRPKQLQAPAAAAPSPARGNGIVAVERRGPRPPPGDGIAWAVGEVRTLLESIVDVDGVKDLLERLPECVLLGGIAACRELVAALLGEHGVAFDTAAVLVAPGMRQPMALELRSTKEAYNPMLGPEADEWLRKVTQAASQALGSRIKADTLRLRLSHAGCANLDVIHLPDRSQGSPGYAAASAKLEEIRVRHVGSQANILVCLEPGPPLELCRRFDPQLRRTVLLGAAASSAREGGDSLPAAQLCGPDAAICLEERFAAICREREPQWMTGLERLEVRLSKSLLEARDVEQREASEEVLRRARNAGLSFGRALQEVIGGAPGCNAGALTLDDELVEFAAAAAKGRCGTGGALLGEDAATAAAELFAQFDGVEGYAAYLRNAVKIPGADVALNGGAAWNRLLGEIEVAMRLATPPKAELANLGLAAIRAGGTGVHGHTRWEDVSSKLMLCIAFGPLLRRVRYIAARVVWVLKHQKAAVSDWMATLVDGPASRIYSPLFAQHLAVLRSSPIIRDLVFGAFDEAASAVGEQILKNLTGTLTAACINPAIMLRPKTESTLLDPVTVTKDVEMAAAGAPATVSRETRSAEARKRVAGEMRRRSGPSGGVPAPLRDRVFEPKEANKSLPLVEAKLRRAFTVLADILANQAFAFSDAGMSALCRRQVDEAMTCIEFSPEQRQALTNRHYELAEVARQVSERLNAVRQCIQALRRSQR